MAARKLRLAFAMGGGVSLGAFSGAALSELLKLVLLAKDKDDPARFRWDSVELDVLSGASAGALSLLIMIRALAAPGVLGVEREDGTTLGWATAEGNLAKWLKARGLDSKEGDYGKERWRDLVAAQLVQDTEHFAWVEEIDFARLSMGSRRRTHEAGLLDQEAVLSIARKVMGFRKGAGPDATLGIAGQPRVLLGRRVLFACSLTNLQPVLEDFSDKAPKASQAGLRDGFRNLTHRESRVFDLGFGDVEDNDIRSYWIRYRMANSESGTSAPLDAQSAWARMTATAVACGAFPFAFEPVVLPRADYEYRDGIWGKELGKPAAAAEERKGIRGMYPVEAEGVREHVCFAYTDGGVFNNEPIREAFRLASFIDAQYPDEEVERMVLFVDPAVSEELPRTPLAYLARYHRDTLLKDILGEGFAASKTMRRLASMAMQMVGALRNEASGVEAAKVFATEDRFQDRDALVAAMLRSYGANSDGSGLPDDLPEPLAEGLRALGRKVAGRILAKANGDMFPTGGQTLESELRLKLSATRAAFKAMAAIRPEPQREAKEIVQFVGGGPGKGWMAKPLLEVVVDDMMDLTGKSVAAKLIAVGPFQSVPSANGGKAVPLPLLGDGTAAFDGFFSREIREHDFAAGQFCAAVGLGAWDPSLSRNPGPAPNSDLVARRTRPQVADGRKKLIEMAVAAIGREIAGPLGLAPIKAVVSGAESGLKESLAQRGLPLAVDTIDVPLLIRTDDQDLELDERNLNLGKDDAALASVEDGEPGFVLLATCQFKPEKAFPDFAKGIWSGRNVDNGERLVVDRDRFSALPDATWLSIQMPTAAQVKDWLRHPTRMFVADLRGGDVPKGTRYDSTKWKLVSLMPTPLEERLLR